MTQPQAVALALLAGHERKMVETLARVDMITLGMAVEKLVALHGGDLEAYRQAAIAGLVDRACDEERRRIRDRARSRRDYAAGTRG